MVVVEVIEVIGVDGACGMDNVDVLFNTRRTSDLKNVNAWGCQSKHIGF